MSFDEVLAAIDEPLHAYYKQLKKNQPVEDIFHSRLLEAYNSYLIIGGLPECVASWVHYKDPHIRYSKRGYVMDGGITNLPLYLVGMTKEFI